MPRTLNTPDQNAARAGNPEQGRSLAGGHTAQRELMRLALLLRVDRRGHLFNCLARSYCLFCAWLTGLACCLLSAAAVAATSASPQKATQQLLTAEIALDRKQASIAKQIYQDLALQSANSSILERALALKFDPESGGSAGESLSLVLEFERMYPSYVPVWFYKAHLAFLVEDYSMAADTLSKILRFNPQADLGKILKGINPKDGEQNQQILTALEELNSSNASILFLRSALHEQAGNLDEALTLSSLAIERQPDSLVMILHKARLLEQQLPQQGAEFLQKMSKQLPQYPVLALEASRVLIRSGQTQQAYHWLKKSVSRFADDSEIQLLAALIALETKHYNHAIDWFTDLTQEYSYADQAHLYLALAYLGEQNTQAALNSLAQVGSGEFYLKAQKQILDLKVQAGEFKQANEQLEKLKRTPNTRNWALAQQILLLNKSGDTEQALSLAKLASNSTDDPQVLLAYLKIIPASEVLERWALFERSLSSDPDNELILAQYARFLLAQAKNPNSVLATKVPVLLAQLEQMLSLDDASTSLLELLARVYLQQQKPEQAADLLVQLYFDSPNQPTGQLLYDTLVMIGDTQAAQLIAEDIMDRF